MLTDPATITLLLMAIGIGALHALDADHVMAVSALAARRPDRRRCLLTAAGWSAGHALTLIGAGAAVFVLGRALPSGVEIYAERAAAILLAGIGLLIIRDLLIKGARLTVHRHPSHGAHLHWVRSEGHPRQRAEGAHEAVFVGACHGLAGSAPALALIPAGTRGTVWEASLILVAFSLGVLAMMVGLGVLLARVIGSRQRPAWIRLDWLRAAAGGGSIVLGAVIFLNSY